MNDALAPDCEGTPARQFRPLSLMQRSCNLSRPPQTRSSFGTVNCDLPYSERGMGSGAEQHAASHAEEADAQWMGPI